MWIDDRIWPDRAIELYKRVYSQPVKRAEVRTKNPISSLLDFFLGGGGGGVGRLAMNMEIHHREGELRLKKLRVEKLIEERGLDL